MQSGGNAVRSGQQIKQNVPAGHVIKRLYYMALSHKDWELPNSRI